MDINLNNIVDILPSLLKVIQDGAKDDFGGNQSLYLDLERSILESALECFESATEHDGEKDTPKQNHNDDEVVAESTSDCIKNTELSEMERQLILDKYGTMDWYYANIYPYVWGKYGS